MKHLVLLAATLGMAAMTAHSQAAELLRVAGIGYGSGHHAYNDCPTCARGGPIGPGAGYGGYAGCCQADYPQRCCEDVWAGYCDEPRCHFWSRLYARMTTDRPGHDCPPPCCPPEYGCNRLKKLFHTDNDCCVEEALCCEVEEEADECCEPCCHHKGVFGWLRRACGGPACQTEVCTECAASGSESSDPAPAPPAATMNDPA